jgi:hypothetical protein
MMIEITFQRQNTYLEIALMIHNPFRDDDHLQAKSGKLTYRYFLQELIVNCNERILFSSQFSPNMAANPSLVFKAKNILKNDIINVLWQDNLGKSGVEKFKVIV